MKTIKYVFTFIVFFAIISCKKNEDGSSTLSKPDCQKNKYGTVTISNSSSNPYDISIDGTYNMRLSGGAISSKIKLNEGNGRKLYAKQVSGYAFYPTEANTSFNVVACSDYSWQIP